MKNTLLKYYIVAIYFCSNVVLFAQTPGVEDTTDTLEETTTDTTPMPIDDYIWFVALIGLMFVFLKYKSIQNRKLNS